MIRNRESIINSNKKSKQIGLTSHNKSRTTKNQGLLSSLQSYSHREKKSNNIYFKNKGINVGKNTKPTPFQLNHLKLSQSKQYTDYKKYASLSNAITPFYSLSLSKQCKLNKSKEDLPYFNTQCFFNHININKRLKRKMINDSTKTIDINTKHKTKKLCLKGNRKDDTFTLILLRKPYDSYLENIKNINRHVTIKQLTLLQK